MSWVGAVTWPWNAFHVYRSRSLRDRARGLARALSGRSRAGRGPWRRGVAARRCIASRRGSANGTAPEDRVRAGWRGWLVEGIRTPPRWEDSRRAAAAWLRHAPAGSHAARPPRPSVSRVRLSQETVSASLGLSRGTVDGHRSMILGRIGGVLHADRHGAPAITTASSAGRTAPAPAPPSPGRTPPGAV